MTFRSLYRLEQRGLLDCPIVGVAVDDWTVDQLVERARESIVGTGEQLDEEVFRRFAARLSYVSGDFGDAATYERVAEAHRRDASLPVFYLEIPPFLFGRVVKGLAEAGLTKNARVVVEKPFGHDLASARALADELHAYIDESQLFRIDHYLGKMGIEEIVYLRFANTMLEPIWSRELRLVGADHDGGGLRRRGPRPLLRPGRRAARRRRQPPDAGRLAGRDGGARARRPADDQGRPGLALPRDQGGRPAHYVRGQYDGYRSIDGVAPDSTTETYAALRLEIENWRWAGVPFFIRTGKRLPVTQTELRLVFKHPPRLGFPAFEHDIEPNQLVVKLDPSTGDPAHRRGASRGRPRPDRARHGVRRRGRGGPDAVRGAAPRGAGRREHCASRARTRSRSSGGSCSRCSTRRHRCTRTRPDRGARTRRTSSSPAPAAGTGRGSRHERLRDREATGAAERGGAVAVPADRRLRVPVELPHGRARRARRRDRLALRAGVRLAERVRQPARPPGRVLPVRAVRRSTIRPHAQLRARHERARDDLEDADRLGRRPRRADDGAARARGRDHAAHAAAGRRRRRPHARAHGRVHRRVRSRSSSSASRCSTTAATPASGRSSTASSHVADATRRRRRRSASAPISRSGVEGNRVRARHIARRRASAPTARSRGPRSSPLRRTSTRPRRGSRPRRASGAPGSGGARIPDHRWRDPIQRSALAIKGLTYMPTGATVAALTTSLPETPGGERNWDYRYTWMRDTTFTLQALHWLNLDWEADEFMQFVADVEPTEDGSLQIMYGIDGRRDLTESTLDDLSGYAGARPVRIGNGAFDQRQNDVFGAVLDSILLHTRTRAAAAAAAVADRRVAGRVRDEGLAGARPGDLGGARRAAALRLVEADVLGRARPGREARRDPRRPRAGGRRGARPPRRSAPTSSSTASRERGVLRQHYDDRRARRVGAARRDLRVPARRRRAPARDGARDRRRADRERLRAALPHRRDRRRPLGQGGDVPDLLVLARLGARDRRRAAARARPDGAAAADRLAARALRRGVRRRHRPPPRQLPAGVLAPRADRGRRADHRPRAASRSSRDDRRSPPTRGGRDEHRRSRAEDDSQHDSGASRSPELVAVPHAHGRRARRGVDPRRAADHDRELGDGRAASSPTRST